MRFDYWDLIKWDLITDYLHKFIDFVFIYLFFFVFSVCLFNHTFHPLSHIMENTLIPSPVLQRYRSRDTPPEVFIHSEPVYPFSHFSFHYVRLPSGIRFVPPPSYVMYLPLLFFSGKTDPTPVVTIYCHLWSYQ